jgi:DNA-binding GntR family transcriptional regulator
MARERLSATAAVDDLTEALREAIISGAIPPGTWLRQERIAVEYGTSRTPVREALRALQAQGIVEVVPNRGALVSGLTVRDIREGYAVRAQLEGYAAELAAEFASDDQIRRLVDAENLFRKAVAHDARARKRKNPPSGERPQWSVANDRFHDTIIDAAGNSRLAQTIRMLHPSFARNLTWALIGNTHLLDQNVKQHREITRGIEQRTPHEAREAMVRHVERSGELVILKVEQLQGGGALAQVRQAGWVAP